MPEIRQLQLLFDKYMRRQCNTQELEVLTILLQHAEAEDALTPAMQAVWDKVKNENRSFEVDWEKMYTDIINVEQDVKQDEGTLIDMKRQRWFSRPWLKAAAVILIVFGTCIYFLFFNTISQNGVIAINSKDPKFKNDVAPGRAGAILTLADGSKIILDSATNGTLTIQGNTRIIKQNGQVTYNDQGNAGDQVVYNTMTTPKGRQFNLMLADGSRVWLNASSSITFPNAFVGNDRRVEITGEVYFEVAKDAARPFKVKTMTRAGDGGEVKVTGTAFNINAYDDEGLITTTLIEGSVKVSKGDRLQMLIPGQQAQINAAGGIALVPNADVDEAVAWKKGRFQFESADIKAIMRELARWYDVDVVYEGDIRPREFTGKISRNVNASKVLNMLEYANVHFRIEGKTIVIMP